jgi:hypothetical protein
LGLVLVLVSVADSGFGSGFGSGSGLGCGFLFFQGGGALAQSLRQQFGRSADHLKVVVQLPFF